MFENRNEILEVLRMPEEDYRREIMPAARRVHQEHNGNRLVPAGPVRSGSSRAAVRTGQGVPGGGRAAGQGDGACPGDGAGGGDAAVPDARMRRPFREEGKTGENGK